MLNGPYDRLYSSTYASSSGRVWNSPGVMVSEFLNEVWESPAAKSPRCLDFGAGEGDNAIAMARAGFSVIPVELSRAAAEMLDSRVAKLDGSVSDRIEGCRVGDFTILDFEMAEVVVMYGVLHCFETRAIAAAAFSHASRHVVPGGYMILSFLTSETPIDDAHPELSTCFLPTLQDVAAWASDYVLLRHQHETFEERHPGGPVHEHTVARVLLRKL